MENTELAENNDVAITLFYQSIANDLMLLQRLPRAETIESILNYSLKNR